MRESPARVTREYMLKSYRPQLDLDIQIDPTGKKLLPLSVVNK